MFSTRAAQGQRWSSGEKRKAGETSLMVLCYCLLPGIFSKDQWLHRASHAMLRLEEMIKLALELHKSMEVLPQELVCFRSRHCKSDGNQIQGKHWLPWPLKLIYCVATRHTLFLSHSVSLFLSPSSLCTSSVMQSLFIYNWEQESYFIWFFFSFLST